MHLLILYNLLSIANLIHHSLSQCDHVQLASMEIKTQDKQHMHRQEMRNLLY